MSGCPQICHLITLAVRGRFLGSQVACFPPSVFQADRLDSGEKRVTQHNDVKAQYNNIRLEGWELSWLPHLLAKYSLYFVFVIKTWYQPQIIGYSYVFDRGSRLYLQLSDSILPCQCCTLHQRLHMRAFATFTWQLLVSWPLWLSPFLCPFCPCHQPFSFYLDSTS